MNFAKTLRAITVVALLSYGALKQAWAQLPQLTISRANQTIFLTWFADNGVPYQVEASTDLQTWSPLGSIVIGGGGFITVQQFATGQRARFFRLRIPSGPYAVYNPATFVLAVNGDDADNTITVGRDASGRLLVNGGAVPISGGDATVANTGVVRLYGNGGSDVLALDETNGALPGAEFFGAAGNDTLIGGSGSDLLNGGPGNDTLLGKGGVDALYGGPDDDTLTGGAGGDQVFGEAGNDRLIWNSEDDSDWNEGGTETDTVEVNGGEMAEEFSAIANGTRVRLDRLNPKPFFSDIGTCEKLLVNGKGGNDRISAAGNLAALISLTVDGGAGDDTILGGNGADTLIGGDDHDTVDGNQGADFVSLGNGNDTFQWDPGDGSDTVEGQLGNDRMLFNGANTGEVFVVSANASRVRFTRDIASIVVDLNDVEVLELNALGGADTLTVNELTGTTLINVIAHLAAFGGAGDAQADIVTVNGTEAADLITPSVAAGQFTVSGLAASVQVDGFEPANDTVRVQGLGGADVLDASALTAGGPKLVLDGGTQNDTLLGSANGETLIGGDDEDTLVGEGGADFLYGGAGHDTLVGGTGDDQVFGEGGNDRLIWNPGDETDLNEGGNDVDTVEVNGGNGAEEFTATANGTRVRLDRLNPAPFSLDIATCEKLIVNANGGNDRFSATGNLAALIAITADGGAGDDTILGSNGADTLLGGDDNDFVDGNQGFDAVSLGSGNDTFQWDPGDGNDSVEGDLGNDVIVFNGSNIAEAFALSSNGSRVSFTRNVAAIALDANGMEQFDLRMLGGADTLTVNDLTGTGLTLVNLDLAATFSGTTGDGLADVITVNGTVAPDVINVVANAGVVELTGLAAQMRIRNSEPANDNLSINGLGGDDTFNIGNGVTSLIQVTPNQ